MDDEIVISGISGKFSESDNMWEFRDHLLNHDDLTSIDDRRWKLGTMNLPDRFGKLKVINKFDDRFFGIGPKQVENMDFQIKMFLEAACEAIYDSGNSLESLRGSRTGVYVSGTTETLCSGGAFKGQDETYVLFNTAVCLTANRISHCLDLKGPSLEVESACSSSLQGLFEAFTDIRNGCCDSALILATNVTSQPALINSYNNLKLLSVDGVCKSFDESGNGYGRGEALVAVFLQKTKVAKRVYATVINARTGHCGFREQGLMFPSGTMQKDLILRTYAQVHVSPKDVSYVEAHGTGTQIGDYEEANALTDVFYQGRDQPLLIGAVKSNMGHAEIASGLCSIAKVIIAMEEEVIPANLHFKTPNPNIQGLMEGRLKVISENTPWKGGLAGINGFGIGGSSAHVILRSNPKLKSSSEPLEGLKLFAISGRNEKAVDDVLTLMENNTDPHLYALWSDIMNKPPKQNNYRGYCIQNSEGSLRAIENSPRSGRPIWFVYPGMGVQWGGMGRDLLQFDVCRRKFYNLNTVMKKTGLNLIEIIENFTDEDYTNDVLKASLANVCIQLVLTETLKEIGILPDGIIGHSVGELVCAFADGCVTTDEIIKAVLVRTQYIIETKSENGSMAVVGMTREETAAVCPQGLYIACHNSRDSVTVSGPTSLIDEFIAEMKKRKVFVRKVNSCGFAFHSPYMKSGEDDFREYGKRNSDSNLLDDRPRIRSSRWISTTFPESEWDSPNAKTFNWNYLCENIERPVLFYEALKHVPENSVIIEIGAHCLLLNLLKNVFGSSCICFGLQNKTRKNNLEYFLTSLGRMYISGVNMTISNLYQLPSFPVPKGTPMISPLIGWDHSKDHFIPSASSTQGNCISFEVNLEEDSKDHFLVDHQIDGRNLYPATGYLVLVWQAFAKTKNKTINELAVKIENVSLLRATVLSPKVRTKFQINIAEGSGEFEISERGTTVATGRILAEDDSKETFSPEFDVTPHEIKLQESDVYKELRLRGYQFGPAFQGIKQADLNGVEGQLKWNDNWIVFLDNILQFSIISTTVRELSLPVRLQQVKINPMKHKEVVDKCNGKAIPLKLHPILQYYTAGGVEIIGLKAVMVKRSLSVEPVLCDACFIPYSEERCFRDQLDTEEKLQTYYELCKQKTEQILMKVKPCGTLQKFKNLISKMYSGKLNIEGKNQLKEEILDSGINISLLQTLDAVLNLTIDESFFQKTQNLLNNLYRSGELDFLLSIFHHDRILRPYLQTVFENTRTLKPKIVEVDNDNYNFGYKTLSFLNSSTLEPIYYLATSGKTQISDKDKQLSKVDLSTWDVTSSQFNSKVQLIVANQILSRHFQHYTICLRNMYDSLVEGGFLLVVEPKQNNFLCSFLLAIQDDPNAQLLDLGKLKQAFVEAGFKLIGSKSDGFYYDLFLLRKVENRKLGRIIQIDDESFEWVKEIKESMKNLNPDETLWLKSENNPTSGILGLINCLRYEPSGQQVRCLYDMSAKALKLDSTNNSNKQHNWESPNPKNKHISTTNSKAPTISDMNIIREDLQQGSLLEALMEADLVINVIKDSQWCSFSFLPANQEDEVIDAEHAYVNCLRSGDLSSLQWIESPMKYQKNTDFYHIYYSALNFRDIMLASGRLPPDILPEHCRTDDCLLGLEFSGRDQSGKRVMGIATDAKAFATTIPSNRSVVWPIPDKWTLEEAATVPVVYSTVYYALILRGKLKSNESILIHSGSGGIGQAAISLALSLNCRIFVTVGSQQKREFLMSKFPALKVENFANSRDTSFEFHVLQATEGKGVDVVLNSLSEDKLQASVRCLAYNGRFLEIGKYDLAMNNRLGMYVFLKNISFHGIVLDFDPDSPLQGEVHQLMKAGIDSGVVQPLNTIVFEKHQWQQAFRYMASGQHTGKLLVKIRDEETEKITISSPMQVKVLAQVYCDPASCYIITGGLGGFGFELANWLIDRGAKHLVLNARSGLKNGYQMLWMKRWKNAGVDVRINNDDVSTKVGATSLILSSKATGPIGGIFHLAMVLRDAVFENQSSESFFDVYNPKVNSAKNLDQLTRLHCPKLPWFVLFSSIASGFGNLGQSNYGFANSALERICEKRLEEGFHGLAIQWGAIGDVGVAFDNWDRISKASSLILQPLNSCLKVLEKFLNHDKAVVMSYVVSETEDQKSEMTMMEKIMNVLGLKNLEQELYENILLSELGLDSLMMIEIKTILERDYECYLNFNDFTTLTLAKLRTLAEEK